MLAERSKRAALQAETEDNQRQLKRSMAKVTALGRDREEREAKLRAKQVVVIVVVVVSFSHLKPFRSLPTSTLSVVTGEPPQKSSQYTGFYPFPETSACSVPAL